MPDGAAGRRSALGAASAAAGQAHNDQTPNRPAHSYGVPGGSVGDDDTAWASNRQVVRHGTAGEVKTAAALTKGLPKGVTILHDLTIPIPGFKANIDHVVVAGRKVTIVDAKSWAGGFYWTAGGKTRRGLARFEPAEKETLVLAADRIGGYLAQRGIDYELGRPLVVVWATSGRCRLWAAQFPGAQFIQGERLRGRARRLCGREAADGVIVAALARLVR